MHTVQNVAEKREFLITLIRLGYSEGGSLQILIALHKIVSSTVVPMMRV